MKVISGAWQLTEDIHSNYKHALYGKKNEWVEVIGDYSNVVIVQGIGGNRYPVNKNFLSQGNIPAPVEETLKKMEEARQTKSISKPVQARSTARSKPAPTSKQQSIF